MTIFTSTINQTAFLLLLIAIGYLLVKIGALDGAYSSVLSKLENNIFVPALMLGTFMNNFTVEKLSMSGKFFIVGIIVMCIMAPLATVIARFFSKNPYERKIYTYGFAFANFGFMGNAVVSALFPEMFMQYLILTTPYQMFIYAWAVPTLLIPVENATTLKERLRPLLNPMFGAVILGIIIGLLKIPLPSFMKTAVTTLGNCMSPVAMLLTGMTIAKISLEKIFKTVGIYVASFLRLIVIPIIVIAVLYFLPMSYEMKLCIVCSVSMPLGLNTVVIPGAYGKDTSLAAGMALISHTLSVATIPLIFMFFEKVISH